MKRLILIIFFACSLIGAFAQKVDILPLPNPPRLVNDEAHLLNDYDRNMLESKLVALDNNSSNQIAIVTIPTLGDNDVDDYANRLFRAWGIGGKKNNNGVLILIAQAEHKIRIEVGYGLEGAITDVASKDIIRNDLTPAFKQGNYFSGLNAAVESLSKAAVGEYKERRNRGDDGGKGGGSILGGIVILIIIFLIIGRRGGGGGRRGGGGDFITGAILGSMLNSGSRSSWGSGSSWGGGGGGGGFGGFGGGSSGGGGASGGW